MANYLKHGTGMSRSHDDWMGRSKALTPKSERPRSTWGSLLMSAQSVEGLCSVGRKCVRKDAHDGACWPEEN